MQSRLLSAQNELESFYEDKRGVEEKEYVLACDYLQWVEKKTRLIREEKHFVVPPGIVIHRGNSLIRSQNPEESVIQRGSVLWMEFGFNIDEEFGGRLPGVVLKIGGNTAIVVPLSSKEPTEVQKASGIYAEIPHVYSFKPMKRWANVLNTLPLSIQRFDFSRVVNVKGADLDRIAEAMRRANLFR